MDKIVLDAKNGMEDCVRRFKRFLDGVRTGYLSPKMIESVGVNYGAGMKPLHRLASITGEDRRTIIVTVFDRELTTAVEKALSGADLGLNLLTAGARIRIVVPPLTEESRSRNIRLIRLEAEKCRISVRVMRRDANLKAKLLLKKKNITERDDHDLRAEIQTSTDDCTQEIDRLLRLKEAELLSN